MKRLVGTIWADVTQFLNLGLHVSPAANQDTHRKNWGTVTSARTVVWADSFDYSNLISAIQANRVYATEDDELVVVFQVEHMGQKHWMGSTIPLSSEEADVEIVVRVWQENSVDEGPYLVTIISDSDGIGGRRAAPWGDSIEVPANVLTRIPVSVVAGEYLYLEITELGGSDNVVGDGDDEFNNDTGDFGSDGKRDDLNDSAWTSPVWFTMIEVVEPTFIWSKKSDLYHEPDCFVVNRIGDANRREGPAPAGKTKHDCHP